MVTATRLTEPAPRNADTVPEVNRQTQADTAEWVVDLASHRVVRRIVSDERRPGS
jgi:hypothetical protein